MKKQFSLVLRAVAVLCVALTFIVSCTQKKDRLVSNTLNIVITPQSVAVSTGTTQTLTAVCKSATSNNVDVAPSGRLTRPFLAHSARNPEKPQPSRPLIQ